MARDICQQVFGKRWSELSPEERQQAYQYRRKVSYYRNHVKNVTRQRLGKRYTKRDLLKTLHWEAKCQRCGYARSLAALDFHHTDPSIKVKNVMTLSWDAAMVEACKCELICANCHREHHAKDDTPAVRSQGRPRQADPLLEIYMRASGCTEDQIAAALSGRPTHTA